MKAPQGTPGSPWRLVGVSRIQSQSGHARQDRAAEKISHLKALGAEVVLTRSDVGRGHPQYYQDLARALAQEDPNGSFINQFETPANPTAHLETTGLNLGPDRRQHRLLCGWDRLGWHGQWLRQLPPKRI